MRTTIKDIAAMTGLSITTVSLVLNNKPSRISEQSKALVFEAAKKLHYRPNELAVGLIKKHTKTLGLLLTDICNPFFASLAKGVEACCSREGWTVILCDTGESHDKELAYMQTLSSKNVDGIIYCASMDSTAEKFLESWEMMELLGIPCVVVDRSYEVPGIRSVSTDHVMGGWLAAEHLLKLGHRRIACVTGPRHLDVCRDRLEGYRMALNKYQIPYDPALICEQRFSIESGRQAVAQLAGQPYTAVFAFNDMMAYGVCQELRAQGLRIPEDVSVIGYDDIYPSQILEVPLTTVRQPIEQLGIRAAQELIAAFSDKVPPEHRVLFEPELAVRGSTASAPER